MVIKKATKFFNVKSKGSRKLQVRYDGLSDVPTPLNSYDGISELPEDFIKFRIRDAVNGKYIIFPALLSGITDNSSQQPTEIQYIGRPDKVYVYGTTDRTISFSLNVVALNEKEIQSYMGKDKLFKRFTSPTI